MAHLTYLTDKELGRLKRLAGENHKPDTMRMITDIDFDAHAEQSQVKDVEGNPPEIIDKTTDPDTQIVNPDYVITVDLYRAASYAWHQKAGVYAEQFEFEADGGIFKRNQAYDMCIKQAARYADMSMGGGSVAIIPVKRDDDSTDAFQDYLDDGGGLPS